MGGCFPHRFLKNAHLCLQTHQNLKLSMFFMLQKCRSFTIFIILMFQMDITGKFFIVPSDSRRQGGLKFGGLVLGFLFDRPGGGGCLMFGGS